MTYTLKQLVTAWTAVHDGLTPDAVTLADLQNRAAQANAGAITDAQALSWVLNSADKTTALAVLSYQFFTGKSPTKDGLAYLVNSDANTSDLNDGYYAQLSTENRYIAFAGGLGVAGEGAAGFATRYGAMSFADYVASIYETIIGASFAKAAGLDPALAIADIAGRQAAILDSARASGLVTPGMTQAQIDLALKAATAGYLLGEAMKADVGAYAASANNFMLALAQDKAVYNTDLTTTYAPAAGSGSSGAGQAVTTSPPTETVVGYVPPPPPPPPPTPTAPPPAPAPLAFTLTTGVDTFTGRGAADTFTATIGTGATLNTGDVLDGAGGQDTLTLTNAADTAFVIAGPTIRNIERLLVTSSTTGLTVDMTGATGFTEVRNIGSNSYVNFSGLTNASTVLGVSGSVNAAIFTFADAALAGNADVVTLSLNDATVAASINLSATTGIANQFETLNIISNGTKNSPRLATSTAQTSLATINISGAAPLTLTFSTSTEKARTVATIDASATTGGVTIGGSTSTTSLGANDQTVKLGSGDDLVYFGPNLTSGDTVDGGAGYDVLGVSAALNATALTNVTNVEAVRFSVANSTFTQNASYLGGRELQLEGSPTNISLNTLANNATVTVRNGLSTTTLSMTLANNGVGSSDSLTLKLSPSSVAGSRISILSVVPDLETLYLVSEKFAGQTAANMITTNHILAKQVITGQADLTMTMGSARAADVDASAFTGKLTISGSSGGTPNDVVILGTGADVVNMRGGTDIIYLGPTTDTSHAYRGADTITASSTTTIVFTDNTETVGGGGSTSYAGVMAATAALGATLKFSAGDDHFSVRNAAGVSAHGLSKGSVAQGLAAGDTMVIQSIAQNDVTTGATGNVSLIKLTTQAAFTTDIKATFAAAMGTASISGLAADGAYLVSMFDGSKMLLALVNTGASAAGDTILSAADFTDTGMVLIGTFAMASQTFTLGVAI